MVSWRWREAYEREGVGGSEGAHQQEQPVKVPICAGTSSIYPVFYFVYSAVMSSQPSRLLHLFAWSVPCQAAAAVTCCSAKPAWRVPCSVAFVA